MSNLQAKLAAIAALESAAINARIEISGRQIDGRVEWSAISPRTYEPLAPLLQVAEAVEELNGQMISYPSGARLFDLKYVALHLVHRAASGTITATEIIEDFIRICETKTVRFVQVTLLCDVHVSHAIEIGGGYQLLPLSQTPTTALTAPLLLPTNIPAHGWGSAPSAALTLSGDFQLSVQAPPTSGEHSPSFPLIDAEDRFQIALNSIILASDGAPQVRQRYTQISSPG